MPHYTIDCQAWARRFLRRVGDNRAQLIRIRSKRSRYIGGVKMPPRMLVESPWWIDHYAVLFQGKMYDEAFPDGLDESEFKRRFDEPDWLEFTPV